MKKIVLTFVAAASMMFAACDSEKSGEGAKSNEPLVAVDPSVTLEQSFEDDHFSAKYPAILETRENMFGTSINAGDDNGASFSASFQTDGPTLSQLAENAEGMAGAIHATGDSIESKIVKGNAYVIKSSSENSIKWTYCILKEDRVLVTGAYAYHKEDAAKHEKYVGAVLNSIKFK